MEAKSGDALKEKVETVKLGLEFKPTDVSSNVSSNNTANNIDIVTETNMETVYLIAVGILIAILMFGLKTGIGCGFSNIGRKNMMIIAGSYFFLSIIIGGLVGYVDVSDLGFITNLGMTIHVMLALVLIGAGIYTQKKWNCGCDVSHHTLLAISLPCPVCLTALFFSTMLLASTLEVSGYLIGIGVGVVFFVTVVGSSLFFERLGKTPESLGSIMTFVGIFYLMGAIVMPAYMRTKQMNLPAFTGPEVELLPFVVFAVFIIGGFALNHIRNKE